MPAKKATKKPAIKPELSVAGMTLHWTFDSGPTAGKTYEHTFNKDGTVAYHELGGDDATAARKATAKKSTAKKSAAKKSPEKKTPTMYGSFEVGDGLHLVSYLSDMGYTLTVFANMEDNSLHGFVSNDKEWMPLTGTQEQVS